MGNLSKTFFLALCLLAVGFALQSCSEQALELAKQKVQFTLSPAPASSGRVSEIELPDDARVKISVASSSGAEVLKDHEISVTKADGVYITDAIELIPGSYMITDFIIMKDSADLYLTPKKGAELARYENDALPYSLNISENNLRMVTLQVTDVRNEDLRKFGYASAKAKNNTLSIAAYNKTNGSTVITKATAEIRQNKKLIKTIELAAAVNTVYLGGDHKLPYTLTVYTPTSAKTQIVDLKKLKQDVGKKPLQVVLDPALVLTIHSAVDQGNENEEYFDLRMEGSGSVNVNWGDGFESAATLPFEISHEYIAGTYTAIVTGEINKVTDFAGFSYSSYISTISGFTNLTALKVYDPSWGAVPIKVDLSNCKQLERINIAKYGAPYESSDLRTDFKLPSEHFISTYIFDAPSFDINREFISAEELEYMVNNIYVNVLNKQIFNGKFFVNPVATPSAATQQKIDVLTNQYNWQVGFNDEIYNAYDLEAGRSRVAFDSNSSREQWLRERFENGERIIERGELIPSN